MKKYRIAGLMSGSSLDGLDIAIADFELKDIQPIKIEWKFIAAETIPFSDEWQQKLRTASTYNALDFCKLNAELGHYFGSIVKKYLTTKNIKPDYIASHGHTIFHYPNEHFTVQIGDGAAIAAITGIDVITEFRTTDVAIGGQGAPLAPLADKYMFEGYDFYVNIGGIANISCNVEGNFYAFDTGAANQVLNSLAQSIGKEYDDKGNLAALGSINLQLLEAINSHPYYQKTYPKSLDNTWVQQNVLPILQHSSIFLNDKLATATEHIAQKLVDGIKNVIRKESFVKEKIRMLITGGGAFNDFLIERINAQLISNGLENIEIVIPNKDIINFKEALLIGLLGLLRIEKIPNSLATSTGAAKDNINGCIYLGN